MKLSTPRAWYVDRPESGRLIRLLLVPLSLIWRGVTRRRIRHARPLDPGPPVICVGNLTMGGTGKTPVVRALLAMLTSWGVDACGLSRGYSGRLSGPVKVDPSIHSAADVGDEPLMLSKSATIWISRNRAAGATAAAAAGAKMIVMDDGHQNPTVRKSLSLVVVDGDTRQGEWPFGDGSVFPAGPMREPLKEGLARADAVILMMPYLEIPSPRLLALFSTLPVHLVRLCPDDPPPAGPQVGFAGVGKPWKVERSLKAAGCDLVDFAPFPDHHRYTERDLDFLAARADALTAGLVTTEKDWIRLPEIWRAKITSWPITAKFDDPQAMATLLKGLLAAD